MTLKPPRLATDYPRRRDQSADEHAHLVARIGQVEKMSAGQLREFRQAARGNMMVRLNGRVHDMTREERARFAAVSRFHHEFATSGRAQKDNTFDAADYTLGQLGRRHALWEGADDLDAGRIVSEHRAAETRRARESQALDR